LSGTEYSKEDLVKDNSGVVKELLVELEKTKGNLKDYKDHSRHITCLSSWIVTTSGKPVKITGIALAEGNWKGVLYPLEEIQKAADQLVGTPLKVEHGQTSQYAGREVGKVTAAKFDDMVKALLFEAEVTDQEAIRDVLKRRFKAVSMATSMEYIPASGQVAGKDFEFLEISLVENPACDSCYILHFEQSLSMMKDNNKNIKEDEVIEMAKDRFYLASEEITIDMPADLTIPVETLNKFGEAIGFQFLKSESATDKEGNAVMRYTYQYKKYPQTDIPVTKESLSKEEISGLMDEKLEDFKKELEGMITAAVKPKEEKSETEDLDKHVEAYKKHMEEGIASGKSIKECDELWKAKEEKSEEETEKKEEDTKDTEEKTEDKTEDKEKDTEKKTEDKTEDKTEKKSDEDKDEKKDTEEKTDDKSGEEDGKPQKDKEEKSDEDKSDENKEKPDAEKTHEEKLSELGPAEAAVGIIQYMQRMRGRKNE